MSVAPGDTLVLALDGLDAEGAGVATLDDTTIHVAGALPGERIEALIEHLSPHRRNGQRTAWASTSRLLHAAPERVTPACPAHGECGGCPMQHLAYPAQLLWKQARVVEALAGIVAGATVEPCVAAPRTLGYRNQAKYAIGRDGDGRVVLGAFAPRSHRIVDLAGCKLVEPTLDEVAGHLRDLLEELRIEPWDELRRTGLLRHAVVRTGSAGDVLVALVTGKRAFPGGTALAEELHARAPAVTGVVHNIHEGTGNAIFGAEETTLWGQPFVETRIAGIAIKVGARAFLQLNRTVAERAYTAIREVVAAHGSVAGGIGRLVDVYAGVGAVSFTLADLARDVVAIEENPSATMVGAQAAAAATSAVAPSTRSPANKVRFVTADAAVGLSDVNRADVVVLNPPRAGVVPDVLTAVTRLSPSLVVYLSCNATTLGRDLTALARNGFTPTRIMPFDMLPHTSHVEVVAVLVRA